MIIFFYNDLVGVGVGVTPGYPSTAKALS